MASTASVTLEENQFTTAYLTGNDAHGHPGVFTVAPSWSVSDPIVQITPAADGKSCRIQATVPTTNLGTSVVTATYAPSVGPTLVATVEVSLVSGPIASLDVAVDPPQPIA